MSLIISSIKQNILNDIKNIYEYFSIPNSEDNYNIIIPGLYLGNYDAAISKSFMLNKDINLVINCSHNLKFPIFYDQIDKYDFKYIRIALDDSFDKEDQYIMANCLKKICPIIHDYLNDGLNVYVHCYAGMQRSATIIICYLIYKDFLDNKIHTLQKYYNFIKSKRTVVFKPDPTFVNVIHNYHKNLFNKLKKKSSKLIK